MDLLQVKGNQIIAANGQPVYLRGSCVGGWMNMEEFINGYPGSEHGFALSWPKRSVQERHNFSSIKCWITSFLRKMSFT